MSSSNTANKSLICLILHVIGGNSSQLRWILQVLVHTANAGIHLASRRLLSVLLRKSILSGWGDEIFAWLSCLRAETDISFLVNTLSTAVTQPHRYVASTPPLGAEMGIPSPASPLLRCALERLHALSGSESFDPSLDYVVAVASHIAHTSLLPRLNALNDWIAVHSEDISSRILLPVHALLSVHRLVTIHEFTGTNQLTIAKL